MAITKDSASAHPSTPAGDVEHMAEAIGRELDRLRAARPALLSRISHAENILVTHLSCKRAGIIKPRVRGGELVGYLVKGSGASGAVYRVDAGNFSCSCPDYHRSNLKGCKHVIACYVLGRVFRPASLKGRLRRRRCMAEPKRLHQRHGAGMAVSEPGPSSSYEERTCSRCLAKPGLTYDGQRGEWIACERCEGNGRAVVFVYPKAGSAGRLLTECVGCGECYPHRELVEATEEHESLTWFPGDKLCRRRCAGAHGVL